MITNDIQFDIHMYLHQGLSQDFHNRVSKLRFQEFSVSKSLIEKVKIVTLIMYIYKYSNYMLNSSKNVFAIILKLNFIEI